MRLAFRRCCTSRENLKALRRTWRGSRLQATVVMQSPPFCCGRGTRRPGSLGQSVRQDGKYRGSFDLSRIMEDGSNSGSRKLIAVPRDQSLRSASFLGLLLTQLLGATNDNVLRWLVIGVGKQYADDGNVGWILTAGTVVFVLPYLLLAAPAGYLADRYSKRNVIVACKLAEVVIMISAVAAILIGQVWLLLAVLGMMGAQSALFGPSKLGSIPEMLHESRISAANGLIGLTTVIATACGSVIGSLLSDATAPKGQEQWWLSAAVLIGIAAAGLVASLLLAKLPVADPTRRFPWDAGQQTWRDLRTLAQTPGMFNVALGIAFFWSLGGLSNLNIDQFAFEGGGSRQSQMAGLLVALVIGVGLGSVLAGIWSKGRVELGILPLGALGLAFCSLLLFTVEGELIEPSGEYTPSYLFACLLLFLLGSSGGMFDVPLAAYMQRYSPVSQRGSILAAANFMTFAGITLASVAFWLLRLPSESTGEPLLSARQIFLVCGVLTIPVLIYIVVLIPQATIRFVAWLVTHTFYRIHLRQPENFPAEGPALLVPNHVSWLDGLLIVAVSPRPVRLIIGEWLVQSWWSRGLARIMEAIPVRRTHKSARTAIDTARQALNNGELVCIFPEGGITRSGQLQAFRPSTLEILKGARAPALPVYLDELWGSIFTFRGGRFFWKWPTLGPRRVSIWFGKALDQPENIFQVRDAVQQLGAAAVTDRKQRVMVLPRLMIRKCKKAKFRWKIADSTGQAISGAMLLMRALILRRLLLRETFAASATAGHEKYVGVLLPPTNGAVIVNAACTLAGRVACNLNYTVSADVMNRCIAKAGIKHVLTSKKVMEKLQMDIDAELVLLEDFREKVTLADKLVAGFMAYAAPAGMVDWSLGLNQLTGDDELTVIFTSGSTGDPKGVVLTMHNIGSNVDAIDQVVHLRREDTVLGIVPFFHSLGFTVTLWTILGLDVRCAYHFSPLEAKQVGKLARDREASVLLATPTFLRNYLRRCEPADFEKLDIAVAGAEKLPIPLCEAFEQKFGVRPVEGYGATETSPLVSVNVPASRSEGNHLDCKEGTVGRPVPGVAAKIVDPDNFNDLPVGTPGMLLVKGPNVMKGYLHQPDKTAEVIRDGWYVTGDIAKIDKDGFIEITGRLSRFSKIGGEMVPHLQVEEAILSFISGGNEEEVLAVVASVPDEKKGERLVVLHKKIDFTPQQIVDHLKEQGLPNLFIPSADSFAEVDEIPMLGTGKLDLKGVSDAAWRMFGKE